ncbi:MAG: hypothetical protein BRC26_01785, partial [Nanohaloarchaea archaeon QH_8_44_6]
EHVRQSYVEAGYPKEKIKVIPSILDKKFLTEHKSNFEETFQLLFVGYLKEHKGADLLIPIMQELDRKTEKEFKLTIVGDGPLRETVEEQVEESIIADKIELRGLVPNEELPEVYASHDLLVNPVKWEEPWGRVFLESLSAGTPILANEVENAKALKGVETSSLDIPKFAEKLDSLFDKSELEKLSGEGKEQILEYRPENTVERLNKSVKEMVEQGEN